MSDATSATPVALVHGVGFGPSTFAQVQRELQRAAAGGRVIIVERRGYGTRAALAPPERVEDHVDDLVAALDAAGIERAVVAGCSGGATISLAAALTVPERVVAAISHEPAVGSLGPELMALIATSVQTGGMALVQALAGPATWARLTTEERAELEACAGIVADDARAYLAWEPPLDRVAEAAPVVCTVGQHSSPMRHTIARVVEEQIGAQVVVVADCGHLVQLDAPSAFAAIISAAGAVASTVGATSSTI
jgi:pimeloyl-ACP methyl ester carboxylesterase